MSSNLAPSARVRVSVLALALFLPCFARGAGGGPDAGSEVVTRLREYVRIDTSNPPGNEAPGVAFLADALRAEGIEPHVLESAPGRANLWARLEGGPGRALVLLHHVDVVPVDRRYWHGDPFGGEIRDGHVFGRGALDAKALGVAQLQAFIELRRGGQPLKRPVIFLATADEEAGGAAGVGWLLEQHPEIFADTGWVLTEGGSARPLGERVLVTVEVTQKIPLWIRLVARDQPGHGAMPRSETAVTRLVHALERIAHTEFDPRVTPAVDRYAKARAAAGLPGDRTELGHFATAVADPAYRRVLRDEDPALSALTSDTCAITRLSGSDKVNVIPPEASAELDCRLLPDRRPADFLAELRTLIGDPAIEIVELMRFETGESATDTDLYRAIVAAAERDLAGAVVIPSVITAFTDSHYFRNRGIVAYGYSPFVLAPAETSGAHGVDESLRVDELEAGTRRLTELVKSLAVR
jgi:acetylornithine deacetylase/succinyl-diaminopimelate desuccinylase-like protein